MTAYRCEAVSLRTYRFGEANKIAVFLSREFGLVRGVAYGAAKWRTRFGSALEPMTIVELSFSRKENQELATIAGCEIVKSCSTQGLGLEETVHLSYFAELLSEFGREEIESAKLFRLTTAVLDGVGKVPIQVLARYFEFWILKLEGVLPALDTKMDPPLARKMAELMRRHPLHLADVRLDTSERTRLERVGEELVQYHLEKPLKSWKMLKELL